MDTSTVELPNSLTLDEAYRAAFYLNLWWIAPNDTTEEGLNLLLQYMWTDPARWDDWKKAVARALADGGIANPDHEGVSQLRPEWPTHEP